MTEEPPAICYTTINDLQDKWLPRLAIAAEPAETQYLHSFMWVIDVVSGLGGFVNVQPHTVREIMMTIFTVLWGILAFAFAIGEITSALQHVESEKADHLIELGKVCEMGKHALVFQSDNFVI